MTHYHRVTAYGSYGESRTQKHEAEYCETVLSGLNRFTKRSGRSWSLARVYDSRTDATHFFEWRSAGRGRWTKIGDPNFHVQLRGLCKRGMRFYQNRINDRYEEIGRIETMIAADEQALARLRDTERGTY